MLRDFSNKDYGYKVCLHEAAHAIFMELDGIKNVRFSGPEIYYNFETDTFGATSARVTGDDQPDAIVDDDGTFIKTKHIVAGGVAVRKLFSLNENESGEGGDYADFLRWCAKNPPNSGETAEALWKRAREAVNVMLEDAELRERIEKRADEYFRLLYSDG